MKILHILDHSIPLHSGYTFRTRSILKQQRAMGWETEHVTSGKHTVASPPIEKVEEFLFYRTPLKLSIMDKLPFLNQLAIINQLTKRVGEVIEKTKPDILHAHSPALTGLAALRAGRKYGIPVVYECRGFWEDAAVDHGTCKEDGIRYKLSRALETYVFKHADAVTTICEGLRKDIKGRGIPNNKITVIPNAVDIDTFSVITCRDTARLDELGLQGKTVLGFIGSFYAYEGLLLLLDALPEIIRNNADIRLLLVGGGLQNDLIHEKIKALNLQDFVITTGRVPHTDVQSYYSLVDILIYPRLAMRLTELVTPLKPLEAMAQGKLVIASDVGGHKELIKDGITGRLFKAGDPMVLARVVLDLLDQQSDWTSYKLQGRKYVEEQRNWPVSVNYYNDVYPALMKKQ
ncbi:TIGR04063 family PEP-CTERM/XrtA system glycosyltransferase [Neptunomonas qingdaonensis]|uniref:PEP-CTERM/exosortase A-associated glycosyltransferase, Daro_2409 family n=1 Tax=Neptunomonas qingdaonensis TaxID=1045558 RepID=A0A1I2N1A1_9GAMM|nr:TIGR04063 family PEP-CTERM/XrtA system glycosyltransferase [Neptunomonas qingdaonensis]SFF95151.1 PEP-CTERM/exosortase A-associated glycosyltransferase, Daro_2409 family [Neptunomonas qingdaonensis]